MMKLKSLQILLVIFVLAPSAIFAQDEKSIWVNASAGINSIWLINQNAYQNSAMDYASKFGLTGGLGISYYMTDNLGLSASVGYITLGQNYSQTTTLGSASRKVNLSYIQLPLKFMLKIPMTNYPTWVALGPALMFLTGARQEITVKGEYVLNNPDAFQSGNIKERFKPVDLAMNFSVIKMYPLRFSEATMLLLSFDSSLGLTDINSKNYQLPDIHGNYKASHNFYLGVKVGLMFNTEQGK